MPESSQRTYPIVLLPESIIRAKEAMPKLPAFEQPPPLPPGPAPQQEKATTVTAQATVAVLPGVALTIQPKTRVAGVGLVIAALIAISIRTWRRVTQYPERLKAHSNRVKGYDKELAVYQNAKQCHLEQAKAALTSESVKAFQAKLILETLRRTALPEGCNSRAQRGASERDFSRHLQRYFPGKILVGRTLCKPGYDFPYTPDFIYWDSETQLHIDIEIDEPYAYHKRIPTHFIGSERDETRDQFFLSKGWLVVRFSEEQVVRWPESCCKTVAEAIALIDRPSGLPQFSDVPNLSSMACWTKEEAAAMEKKSYRDTYLKARSFID